MLARIAAVFALCAAVRAQTVCPPVPRYSPCDIVFEVPGADPAKTGELKAEFRSPHHDTALVNAVWDGGSKWFVRYTPSEEGEYTFRVSGSAPQWNGKEGHFTATGNAKKGWLRAANLHHFAYVEGVTLSPHLWMGGVVPGFTQMDSVRWKSLIDTRAAQHFNHLGVTLVDESTAAAFKSPEFFRAAEEKIRYANDRGIIVDIAFFGPNGLMVRLLPTGEERRRWLAYAISRLAAFDVTWQGLEGYETYETGASLLKEIADSLAVLDPYKHTRSTRAQVTSAALADSGWLRYRSYQTDNDQISAVEQQSFQYPAVNNFGAGAKNADQFRRRLWNSTASGQYPATEVPDEASANQMKVWYEFMQTTRHWELEPFFDIENGRGLALEGVEYIVYVEKPGPVTVNVEKQGYDIEWLNPVTGERTKVKEKGKNEVVTFTPPDLSHDWVLHISKEGRKASMLRSYKFDSADPPLELQVPEGNPEKIPFEIVEPASDAISLGAPVRFAVKLKRQTKTLQRMMYEWTGEVTVSERGYRVIATGPEGVFEIPANIAAEFPAALHVKVTAMNGRGKVYVLDRNFVLNK